MGARTTKKSTGDGEATQRLGLVDSRFVLGWRGGDVSRTQELGLFHPTSTLIIYKHNSKRAPKIPTSLVYMLCSPFLLSVSETVIMMDFHTHDWITPDDKGEGLLQM